ncbi:MAG: DHH family phosphoesterase [Nitrososphaerota archaeon]|nr:DHH family phosphoesterase [Nitrososphaerales archaeon]MDW8045135.1 DHH family phosphoesterase [Nitrososphaerota archaeon]
MSNFEELLQRAEEIANRIIDTVKAGKKIALIAHIDADGITTASILIKAIYRKGGRFLVRVIGDLDLQLLDELKDGDYGLYIFCEIGGGMVNEIIKRLDHRWIMIDHHRVPDEELNMKNVFNAWQFGFDGGVEVCGAGMAYFIAVKMDESNVNLSWLPIVGALADRQDRGDKRSLISLNERIVNDALKHGYLKVTTDLLFYGRETKPIHEAIASTAMPYIPGLSGNRDLCLASLTSAGIKLKDDGRWRTIAELSNEEKMKIVEVIIPYFGGAVNEKVEELIGTVYTLIKEDENTPLRDAREFGTLLNACGRMGRASIGISICLNDRDQTLQEAQRILIDYRQELNRYLQTILIDQSRVIDNRMWFLINGDGLVSPNMLSPLASILATLPRFKGRLILAKTLMNSNEVKFSVRFGIGCEQSISLASLVSEAAIQCGGVGGGHNTAAGARIPLTNVEKFLGAISSKLKDLGWGQS